jgi:hypothetical protein
MIHPDEHNGELANPARDLLLDPDEASTPSTAAIDWLRARGVTVETFARYWSVGAARVIEVPGGLTDLAYMPCAIGDFAYIFACQTIDGVADLAAWVPSSRRLLTRLGVAGLLGQRQAEEARDDINARPLRVWRTPLGWLRAGRDGVVIIDPETAAHLLSGLPVIPEDIEFGRALAALRVPPPRVIAHAARRIAA